MQCTASPSQKYQPLELDPDRHASRKIICTSFAMQRSAFSNDIPAPRDEAHTFAAKSPRTRVQGLRGSSLEIPLVTWKTGGGKYKYIHVAIAVATSVLDCTQLIHTRTSNRQVHFNQLSTPLRPPSFPTAISYNLPFSNYL